MTWIHVVEESEATGEMADIYREAKEQGRFTSNVRKAASLNPSAIRALDSLGASFRENSPISHRHREMLAVVTSVINRCQY